MTEVQIVSEKHTLNIAKRELGSRIRLEGVNFMVDVKSDHGNYSYEAGYLARDAAGNAILVDVTGDCDRFCCVMPSYAAA